MTITVIGNNVAYHTHNLHWFQSWKVLLNLPKSRSNDRWDLFQKVATTSFAMIMVPWESERLQVPRERLLVVTLDDDNGHEYLMIAVTRLLQRRKLIFCCKKWQIFIIYWIVLFISVRNWSRCVCENGCGLHLQLPMAIGLLLRLLRLLRFFAVNTNIAIIAQSGDEKSLAFSRSVTFWVNSVFQLRGWFFEFSYFYFQVPGSLQDFTNTFSQSGSGIFSFGRRAFRFRRGFLGWFEFLNWDAYFAPI